MRYVEYDNLPNEKPVLYYSDSAIDQRKIRWLKQDLNSHLRVSIDYPGSRGLFLLISLRRGEEK
jgi:hypothetical protein